MRNLKYLVSALIFIAIGVLNCELLQIYVRNFTADYSYMEIEGDSAAEVVVRLKELSESYNIDFFTVRFEETSPIEEQATIYISCEKNRFQAITGWKEKTYSSFFSGTAQVELIPIDELTSCVNRFYFMGEDEAIWKVYDQMRDQYIMTRVKKETQNPIIRYYGWILLLLFSFLLTLNWLDIQFRKKECAVRSIYGASVLRYVLNQILLDSLFYLLGFTIPLISVYFFMGVRYRLRTCTVFFIGFVLLNALLWLTLLVMDLGRVVKNSTIREESISICYLLKALTGVFLLASLSVTVPMIGECREYSLLYKSVDAYDEYNFMRFDVKTDSEMNILERLDRIDQVYTQVLMDSLAEGSLALSVYMAEYNGNIYLVNDSTAGIKAVFGNLEHKDDNYCVLLIPSEYGEDVNLKSELLKCIDEYFGSSFENIAVYWDYYEQDFNLLYFDTMDELEYGFSGEKNPIMIYCSLSKENGEVYPENFLGRVKYDAMYLYNEKDEAELESKYPIENIRFETVKSRCEKYKNTILRKMILNIVVTVIIMMLSIVVIYTIVRMEYTVNLKKHALENVLGYSSIRINAPLVGLNFAALAASLAAYLAVAGIMKNAINWQATIYIAFVIFAVDNMFTALFAFYTWHKKSILALKGEIL